MRFRCSNTRSYVGPGRYLVTSSMRANLKWPVFGLSEGISGIWMTHSGDQSLQIAASLCGIRLNGAQLEAWACPQRPRSGGGFQAVGEVLAHALRSQAPIAGQDGVHDGLVLAQGFVQPA